MTQRHQAEKQRPPLGLGEMCFLYWELSSPSGLEFLAGGVPAEGGFRSLAHSPRSGDLSGDPRVCRSFSSHRGGYQLSNSQPTRKGLFVPFCKQTPAAQWLQ